MARPYIKEAVPSATLRNGFAACAALVLLAACGVAPAPAVQDGDIIFQTSRSAQSLAIQRATHSPYSHMGLVLHRDGRPFVLEAVATVRYTPLAEWIDRGVGRHFVVKRLRDALLVLTPARLGRLRRAAEHLRGRPYDPLFRWSDDHLYCSELVWKVYTRGLGVEVGALQQLREFDLGAPEVRAQVDRRYGGRAPLGEPVISPAAMFADPDLITVAAR